MIKHHIVYNDFSPWEFRLSKSLNSYIYDSNNKQYIDFTSGWNVTNLGWNHPEVNEAIRKQAEKNVYAPMWISDPVQEEYANLLTSVLPKELDALCRATGGTEAVESAIKIARAATGRKKILGYHDTYHGQLFAAMALGWRENTTKEISPMVPDIIQHDYPRITSDNEAHVLSNYLEKLDQLLSKKDVAALVTEAGIITGWGSVFLTPEGFLAEVRKITKKYGTLLILDEVGTGFSRTGKLFGYQHENVIPDMMTFAKGMTNGSCPMGAVAVSAKLVEPTIPTTNLTSTFGWTPLACAGSKKVLEVHLRDKVWEKAERKGTYLLSTLHKEFKNNELIKDVRGLGMEIGLEVDREYYKKVIAKAKDAGLLLIGDTESVIQLMPPLTIPDEVLADGITILVDAVKNFSRI